MANLLLKTLYSALLRLAKSFDQKRPSKALIYRIKLDREYKSASTSYYSSILEQILGSSIFYSPNRIDNSLQSFVRSEFRKDISQTLVSDRITAGFAFLRTFSKIWSQYENSVHRPRKRIPKEEKFKVSLVDKLENGVMLCAHPLIHGYMQRAIILILEHSDKGSYGIIINKKTDHNVESSTLNMPLDLLKVFSKNTVSFGGNLPRCQIIHPFKECGGKSISGCNPPYYDFSNGSIKSAIEIASKNPNDAKKFHFFVGCCVWKAGVLEQELKDGTWIAITGEANKILQHSLQENLPDTYAVKKRYLSGIDEVGSQSSDSEDNDILNETVTSPTTSPTSTSTITTTTDNNISNVKKDSNENEIVKEKDIYEGQNETWCRVMWSLSRQANQFAQLDPDLDTSVVSSVDWHYSDEKNSSDEDEEED